MTSGKQHGPSQKARRDRLQDTFKAQGSVTLNCCQSADPCLQLWPQTFPHLWTTAYRPWNLTLVSGSSSLGTQDSRHSLPCSSYQVTLLVCCCGGGLFFCIVPVVLSPLSLSFYKIKEVGKWSKKARVLTLVHQEWQLALAMPHLKLSDLTARKHRGIEM